MTLQDRINDVRKALLRNGYMLERSQHEGLRIRQARDVLEAKAMRDRDRQAKEGDEADQEAYNATLHDLATVASAG